MLLSDLQCIIANPHVLLAFLQFSGLLLTEKRCTKCRRYCLISRNKTFYVFRCRRMKCETKYSAVPKNFFLSGSRLRVEIVLQIIYFFANDQTLAQTKKTLGLGWSTVFDWYNKFREVCAFTLSNEPRSIGGEGKTVEIDHTYFTKCKNEEGKMVPDQWVFGGICRETEDVFLCTVPETTEDAITECIKNNIQPGTTIISDCQPSYKNIESIQGYNFKHLMVNNSENVVDPALNANIQSIENIWSILNERNKKHSLTKRNMFNSYLSEFVWRRRYANEDLFFNILKNIASFQAFKDLASSLKNRKPGKGKGKKRKGNTSEESLKLQDSESSTNFTGVEIAEAPSTSDEILCDFISPDPLKIPESNCNEGKRLSRLRPRKNSSVKTLVHTAVQTEDVNLPPSPRLLRIVQVCESEFDLFGKSVSNRLNRLPRNRAVQLRLKIEELVTNFRLQSVITPNNLSLEVPPLCGENFVDIKMEIEDEVIE